MSLSLRRERDRDKPVRVWGFEGLLDQGWRQLLELEKAGEVRAGGGGGGAMMSVGKEDGKGEGKSEGGYMRGEGKGGRLKSDLGGASKGSLSGGGGNGGGGGGHASDNESEGGLGVGAGREVTRKDKGSDKGCTGGTDDPPPLYPK